MHCSKCKKSLLACSFSTSQKRKSAKVRSCVVCMKKNDECAPTFNKHVDQVHNLLRHDSACDTRLELTMRDSEYADYIDFGPSRIFVAEYMERQWEEEYDYDWNDDRGYDYSHDI